MSTKSLWPSSNILRPSQRALCRRKASNIASGVVYTSQKPYYVTSPIFYVNAAPHIGHLYSTVVADIFARWAKMRNPSRPILYTTGTDEHGLKIQQAAKSQGMSPLKLSDMTSQRFRDLAKDANLEYTSFIRTTERSHAAAVEDIWCRLVQKGYIYKGTHSGWYAVSDEAFYPSSQVEEVIDPTTGVKSHRSKETGKEVVWTDEENYKFRLSEFRLPLKQWIEKSGPIYPRQRQEEVINYLSEEAHTQDLSVSRLSSRVGWGLPVPDDPTHTIYVWLDALTSYLTAIGYPWVDSSTMKSAGWPADIHVVGKDIVRFHAVYFPAFLMALDMPLPKGILCHAHWTMNKQKMAKSVGNVVDPFQILQKYSSDSVRWYLARVGGHFVDDADWSLEQLALIHDRDLRDLGNLYRRLHAPSMCEGSLAALPSISSSDSLEAEFATSLMSLSGDVARSMQEMAISRSLDRIMGTLDMTNRYLNHKAPWKADNSSTRASTVALAREALRICGILLQPFLPEKAPLLLNWLGVAKDERSLTWASFGAAQSTGGRVATPDQRLYDPLK
ncbi:methionyl-tRNA synthetase [Serendipita sp. 407]|nr:methionyl-tRNA synthetase [Serendipita sp. 407]